MEQKNKRKKFNQEFRHSAIQLVEGGKSAAQVARELGLPEWQVQTWVRDSKKKKKNPSDQTLLEENKQLKKQLAKALEETEILKKAAAFFARNQL